MLSIVVWLLLLQYVRASGQPPAAGATKQRPNPYVAQFQTAAGTAPASAAGGVAFGSAAAAAAAPSGGGVFGAAAGGGSKPLFGKAAQQPQQQQQGFGSAGG